MGSSRKKAASGREAAYQFSTVRSPAIHEGQQAIYSELGDLAARLRLTIGHFNVLRAIGISFERLVAAEMKFLRCRLAVRPLAGTERRRSMIEQTRDIEDFLLSLAHDSYPIQQNIAVHGEIVQCN